MKQNVAIVGVCFQMVVDKSGKKLREGFSSSIRFSRYSRKT